MRSLLAIAHLHPPQHFTVHLVFVARSNDLHICRSIFLYLHAITFLHIYFRRFSRTQKLSRSFKNDLMATNTNSRRTNSNSSMLYGPNNQKLDLDNLMDKGSGLKKPFDPSPLDTISDLLATHGPALAKLLLIFGSGTATVYNAFKAGNHPGVLNGEMLTTILIAAGLIVECGFAYGWSRRGSYDLAGRQRQRVDLIFNRSSYMMIGDLSLSVAEIAFGIGNIALYWVGIVQPFMAVHVVKLFYKLKGEHPEYIAEMEIVDMRADIKAAQIRDMAEGARLDLAENKHERHLQWASLNERHSSSTKLVGSRWFRRKVSREVKEAVGKNLLDDVRERVGKLPRLLKIRNTKRN